MYIIHRYKTLMAIKILVSIHYVINSSRRKELIAKCIETNKKINKSEI